MTDDTTAPVRMGTVRMGMVGGGQGRMPFVAKTVRPWLAKRDLLSYLEAVLRVYNLHGRRDNKHRARIKILVNALGVEEFTRQVEAEWAAIKEGGMALPDAEIERVKRHFTAPDYTPNENAAEKLESVLADDEAFARWYKRNTVAHKVPGYRLVFISLKAPDIAPGDITAEQMDTLADLADQYSFGEIQTTHWQNVALKDVAMGDLHAVWQALDQAGMATPNIGTLTDMICCPGLDFCSLANAGSIGIARQINEHFDNLDYLYDIGELYVNMSGCMNACGHHHVGHIGILGVDKKGEEWYQITLGGDATQSATVGERLGRAIAKERVAETLQSLIDVFLSAREGEERFIDTYRRIGIKPFQERVYG